MVEHRRAGFYAALKTLLATTLATGKSRLELLVVEIEEEKLRFLQVLISAAAALFFLALGVVMALAFLAVAFWEQRLLVFGGATVFTLAVGGLLLVRVKHLSARSKPIFRGSLTELQKDIQALRAAAADRHE